MVGRLIASLIWLTYVQSDSLANVGTTMQQSTAEKSSMMMNTMPVNEATIGDFMSAKSKRYLSHHHSSPCPPFYPHIGSHMPMYDTRPYGPPAYPKNDIHSAPAMYHQTQHDLQYVHQPTYTSYVPKQTIQYIQPDVKAPIYQHPIVASPIHHVAPIQPIVKQLQSNYYHHYQPPMFQHKIAYPKQPIFAYAPAYQKPMPMIWPATQIPHHDYHQSQPAIVYKPDVPKCAPCLQPIQPIHQHQSQHYVKIIQPPIVHQIQHTGSYGPAPVHQPIVKPCVK